MTCSVCGEPDCANDPLKTFLVSRDAADRKDLRRPFESKMRAHRIVAEDRCEIVANALLGRGDLDMATVKEAAPAPGSYGHVHTATIDGREVWRGWYDCGPVCDVGPAESLALDWRWREEGSFSSEKKKPG